MNKKELLEGIKFIRHRALELSMVWQETILIKKTLDEISSLISSSEPAEVGDEEREKLVKWFDSMCILALGSKRGGWEEGEQKLRDQTRTLLRQRRTVSKRQIIIWLNRLLQYPLFSPPNQVRPVGEICEIVERELRSILAELGFSVSEKEGAP